MINSSNKTQVMPKGNLYPRFRKEERQKTKKCKLSFKKLGEVKPKGCTRLELIKKKMKLF